MHRYILCIVFMIWTLSHLTGCNDLPPPCSSTIYCHGPFLHTIQMAMIYQDSKTFVDLKLKYPPNDTLNKFYDFMEENGELPDRFSVEMFVNRTFEPAGSEFEEWIPNDWIAKPKFLNTSVKDPAFRDWGIKLNELWKFLGRKMKQDVYDHQDLYSIIWVPNPVIVPGGRFREFYYWDSYWIIRGLLLSEMHHTARGMLENFFYIVEQYGFIPNGGRIYYSRRSQPPLLIPMVKLYYDSTKDLDFVQKYIGIMEQEFSFWISNHTTTIQKNGKNYTLAMYGDMSTGPRPESYREDIENAMAFHTKEEKEDFYSELKAAAESGWDFSSRWFLLNGTNKGILTNLKTRYIIPVDLNSFIYGNAVILSKFHELIGNSDRMLFYQQFAKEWLKSVNEILWQDEVGVWLDYDIINNKPRDYFYPSNMVPLWTGCYDQSKKEHIVRHVMDYLKKQDIMTYQGGVPTTLEHTGEQWDYPNAWPPLQHMMIMGLEQTGDVYAQALAYELAAIWVRSNFKVYEETSAMFEKYDATVFGGYGGGGEYEIQLGFGWSNGVIMDLLNHYGHRLTVDDNAIRETNPQHQVSPAIEDDYSNGGSITTLSQVVAGLLALLVSLATGFIGIAIYKKRNQGAAILKNKITNRSHYTELRNIPKKSKSYR